MLIPLAYKRVLSLPLVPLFAGFVVADTCITRFLDLPLAAVLFVALPLSVLAGLALAFPWLLILRRGKEDLVVRSLLRTTRLRIPGSRYRLRDRRLWLCSSDDSEGIALMPYTYERTRRVAASLHQWLGLPDELDVSFRAADSSLRQKKIIISVCVLARFLLSLVSVSHINCDPGSDCSVMTILIGGVRETAGVFRDLLAIALGRGF